MAEGIQINHTHVDGRQCIVGPDGQWRHWEAQQGPLDNVERVCDRPHPPLDHRVVNIDGPEPLRVERGEDMWVEHPEKPDMQSKPAHAEYDDRGEFGIPAGIIGGTLRIGDRTIWSGDQASAGTHDSPGAFDVAHSHIWKRPDVWIDKDGVHRRYAQNGNDTEPVTDDARYILEELPSIIEDFLENNAKYARAQTHDLGLKGIIPDINRKASAIITRVWDGQDYGRDETEELVGDLIGHLLLMLAKMRSDE